MPPSVPADRRQPPPFDVKGKHVYMVGIGGCGMSGLARLLASRGAIVCGSDTSRSDVTSELASEGVEIGFDQQRGVLPERCDFVVHSAAIKPAHPELIAAVERGVATLSYAEALGRCMMGRTGVSVAGTHGKSTTTAMLGIALTDAGLDPSVIVGAVSSQLAAGACSAPQRAIGFRIGAERVPDGGLQGRPGILVAEACEFNRSFHHHFPTVASISSVEADHLDVYGTLDAVVESFREFAMLLPPAEEGGLLLIADEGAHRREITAGLRCKVQTIGFSPAADWVVWLDSSTGQVTLSRGREAVAQWTNRVPGAHNAMNAATACAIAISLGADPRKVERSLSEFRGIDRRMQFLGEKRFDRQAGTVRVYDDYGHHPTEVEATLRAIRDHERPQERGGRLVCVFQPHQHSRTRFLLEEFASAFGQADIVIVPHIYFVRDSEVEKSRVSSQDLVDRLRSRGVHAMHLYPFDAIVEHLQNLCKPDDLVIVMGAGPVYQIAHGFLGSGPAVSGGGAGA
ncbi:MAG: UDP-N-acetylmuramate--L-alanine ligase [Phycisphaeraceae bacterium]|nr:UDP-N-acetylmuramate--L-alanine ligase [Phycisphaeraceae bacterium]MCW5768833.1 UDP-N-acetylmuramate--L-alanine ligase [Phycisphaeraceae bacterium]